jgi:hypothetical protein
MAQKIYTTLWNKPLNPYISNSSIKLDGTVVSYRYFEQILISRLGLSRLRFMEDILLIRDEYTVAYESMQSSYKDGHKNSGGVVVTGQPGIGERRSSTSAMCWLNLELIRQDVLPVLRPFSAPQRWPPHRFPDVP